VTAEYGLADVRGGRVSVGDLDGDGYPDLIVHVIGNHNRADFSKTPGEWPYRVLMNRPREGGGRRFVDATLSSGYGALRDPVANTGRSAQFAIMGDVNDDGALDIFSGTYSDPTNPSTDPGDRSELLLNRGDGTFALAPSQQALSGDGRQLPATSATFVDDDRDGHLDLFLGYWYASYGRSYLGVQNRLVRGQGDGTFDDVTADLGLLTPATRPGSPGAAPPTYGVTACDLNLDGRKELLVSAYGREPNLLWLRGAGGFTEVGVAAGYAYDDNQDFSDNEFYRCYCQTSQACTAPPPRISCDSAAWQPGVDDQPWRLGGNTFTTVCADVDNDGWPDLYNAEIAHWHIGGSSDKSTLLRNLGRQPGEAPTFARPDRTQLGLDVPHAGDTWDEGGIGAGVADLDNDGLPDILLGASDYDDNYLWVYRQKADGTFQEVGAAAGLHHPCAPTFALADLDRDGDLDLIVASSTARTWCAAKWPQGPEVHVYENVSGQDANWTQVHLEGAGAAAGGANRSAIGAVVHATAGGVTRMREVQGGYGHFGIQHDLDVTIGLGAACAVDLLEVRWPDAAGSIERFENVLANYRIVIRQGQGLTYLP
jgi:hypothetical protein